MVDTYIIREGYKITKGILELKHCMKHTITFFVTAAVAFAIIAALPKMFNHSSKLSCLSGKDSIICANQNERNQ